MLIILAVQLRTPGGDPPRSAPLPGWFCALLAVQAVVLLGFGVALFAAPGQAAPWWPWKLTPLLAQATGAWLIGFGVAAAHELAEHDARRVLPASFSSVMLAVLQFIALARYPGRFAWSSAAGVICVAFLVTLLVTGGMGLARARASKLNAAFCDRPCFLAHAGNTADRRVTEFLAACSFRHRACRSGRRWPPSSS